MAYTVNCSCRIDQHYVLLIGIAKVDHTSADGADSDEIANHCVATFLFVALPHVRELFLICALAEKRKW